MPLRFLLRSRIVLLAVSMFFHSLIPDACGVNDVDCRASLRGAVHIVSSYTSVVPRTTLLTAQFWDILARWVGGGSYLGTSAKFWRHCTSFLLCFSHQTLQVFRSFHRVEYMCCRASMGGAVHIVGSYTSVVPLNNIANSTFLGNSAKLGGGALYLDGGLSLLNSNAFKRNSAYGFGGALAYNSRHITSAGSSSSSCLPSFFFFFVFNCMGL